MAHRKSLKIALAGNANVGKSVIFNHLTGLHQHIGNWPGKTLERAEGSLHFKGYIIDIIDLPGIYSLSTYTLEEIVTRDYIITDHPDIVVNVIDASALERNLYFTIQLLELEVPMIIALNQIDLASKKGLKIDVEKLSNYTGTPVIPMIAITGTGINELLSTVIDIAEGKIKLEQRRIKYGREIEEIIEKLEYAVKDKLPGLSRLYTPRYIALKLFERDENLLEKVRFDPYGESILILAETLTEQIVSVHGEPTFVIITSERWGLANQISKDTIEIVTPPQVKLEQKLNILTTHKVLGYPILATIFLAVFITIFGAGNFFATLLAELFESILIPYTAQTLSGLINPLLTDLITNGLIEGVGAGVTIVLPYIIPFFIILAILENTGYLPRAAFLMDNFMHKIGLHGKAFIPMLLGYGCCVPACIGCRILETDRERFIAGFIVVLIPCAARTIVILGLVGKYVGIHAALVIYLFNLFMVFLIGRLVFKALPGEPISLIMEMPPYRRPSISTIGMETWNRTKDFVYVAFPLIIGGSIFLEFLSVSGLIWHLNNILAPVMINWLGLPEFSGIPLIFGVLRKELTLVFLANLAGTFDFNQILTGTQMIVFTLITLIYIPCIATVAMLIREFGSRRALGIIFFDIMLALVVGGIAYKLLSIF